MDENLRAQIEAQRKKFAERGNNVRTNLSRSVANACLLVERDAKLAMRDSTLVLRYKSGKTEKLISVHSKGRSEPGNPPAPDTGRLMGSITHAVETEGEKVVGHVGTNVEYGKYLEYGTSKMAARPWLGVTIEKDKDRIKEIIGESVSGRSIEIDTGAE